MIGLYSGYQDKEYEIKENSEAKKGGVIIVRQKLPVTKMFLMKEGQFVDLPLTITYYMSAEKHSDYFRAAAGEVERAALETRWKKEKEDKAWFVEGD